jgi:hypothetical protein
MSKPAPLLFWGQCRVELKINFLCHVWLFFFEEDEIAFVCTCTFSESYNEKSSHSGEAEGERLL